VTTEKDLVQQINGLKQLITTDREMVRIAEEAINSNVRALSILKGQLIEMRDKALYSNGLSFKDSLIDVYDPDSPTVIYPSILEHRNRYYQEFEDRINGIKPRIGKVYTKRTVKIIPNVYAFHAKISSTTTNTILDTYYKLPVIDVSHNCSNERINRLVNILDTEIVGNLPKIAKLEMQTYDFKTYKIKLIVHNDCSCIVFNGNYPDINSSLLFVFESEGIYIYKLKINDIWFLDKIYDRKELYTALIILRNKGNFNSFREIKEYK